jgi:predicted amidohydrolase
MILIRFVADERAGNAPGRPFRIARSSLRRSFSMTCLVAWLLAACAFAGPLQAAGPDRPLIGVCYFAGWWRPLPNKWNYSPAIGDWRAKFPKRVPLLGEYNEQSTMDKEIVAAAGHGVDFFLILWYYNGPDDSREREKNSRFLNEGVKTFVKSTEAHRMGFAIEYCNHQPYQVKSADDWNHCVKAWTAAMRHPSYLRVGGRLVFKVHSWHHFWDENGKDLGACRARLDGFRKAVRGAGLGEMIIGCGIASGEKILPGHPPGELFDFTGTYMEVPNLPQRDTDYPYEKLAEFARSTRGVHTKDKIPYVPYLGAGFNARPWLDGRARFAIPTKDEWTRELQTMKEDLNRLENLGFPLPDGRRQKALTIYAWNEFGEGGFLAPTKGEGTMKLRAIRDVFGRVRIAGIVLKWIRGDREANLRRAEPLIRQAAAGGAQIVCTTECFLDGYAIADKSIPLEVYRRLGEPIPEGTYFKRLAALARELKIVVVAGMLEADGDARYNTAVLISPEGGLLGKYRKQLLEHESVRNRPGNSSPVFETPLGRAGLLICADRRVPEIAQRMKQGGADFLLCPSGGMFGAKSNDWILQARSRETGLPIVFVHPAEFLVTGRDGSVLEQAVVGDSLLIAPADAGTAKDANHVFYFDLPAIVPENAKP